MAAGVLRRLGFRRGWIYETVVTTQCRDGSTHPAPMGVWTSDFRSIKLRVYKKSATLKNIERSGFFTVNLPDSVKTFHDALYPKTLDYVKAKKGYSISGLSFIEAKVCGVRRMKDYVEFRASVTSSSLKKNFRLFNRGEALALEYLITKTKPESVVMKPSEYRRLIKKVAPKSIYGGIVDSK